MRTQAPMATNNDAGSPTWGELMLAPLLKNYARDTIFGTTFCKMAWSSTHKIGPYHLVKSYCKLYYLGRRKKKSSRHEHVSCGSWPPKPNFLEPQSLKEYMHGLSAKCICSFVPLRFTLSSHIENARWKRETQSRKLWCSYSL